MAPGKDKQLIYRKIRIMSDSGAGNVLSGGCIFTGPARKTPIHHSDIDLAVFWDDDIDGFDGCPNRIVLRRRSPDRAHSPAPTSTDGPHIKRSSNGRASSNLHAKPSSRYTGMAYIPPSCDS